MWMLHVCIMRRNLSVFSVSASFSFCQLHIRAALIVALKKHGFNAGITKKTLEAAHQWKKPIFSSLIRVFVALCGTVSSGGPYCSYRKIWSGSTKFSSMETSIFTNIYLWKSFSSSKIFFKGTINKNRIISFCSFWNAVLQKITK